MASPMQNWTAFYKHKYDEWHVSIPYSEGGMKCALFPDGINHELGELREPVCRLIAAAPALFAALEDAIGALEFSRDYHKDLGNAEQAFCQDKLDAARAAIAQAKGEV